jgi:serine/threonine protein kinase
MGICKEGTDIYVITEYVEGGTLWKLVKNKAKALTWLTRVSFALDVSKAIAYLHARNIIHRDLKCKNLLVDKTLHVKVCDFGLSRDTGENEQKFMTKAGTDRWMAPEVILGNPYNVKADSFSFGMTLYELVCRAKPPERHPMNGYHVETAELLAQIPPDCPPELKQLMLECADKYVPLVQPSRRALSILTICSTCCFFAVVGSVIKTCDLISWIYLIDSRT